MTTLEKLEELVYHGFKETADRFQETDRGLKQLKEEVSGLTKSLGLFAESMVHPSAVRLFSERGIPLSGVTTRLKERRNGEMMEVDVLGMGPDAVVVIEVKLRLTVEHVKEFLNELPRFFDFYPYFRGRKLYGAVAGASIDKGVDRFAYAHGLFILSQSGDNMKIINDEKFVPRVFNEPVRRKLPTKRKK
jgi:hypothetical protein